MVFPFFFLQSESTAMVEYVLLGLADLTCNQQKKGDRTVSITQPAGACNA